MMDMLLPEELDKLQTTLVEHMQEAGCMPLDAAHGFFTAVAAHTNRLNAASARTQVLGKITEHEGIGPLLEKFQQQVMKDLESGEYGPLIMQMPREDESMLPLPYGWCEGYVQGLSVLGEDIQEQALASEEVSNRLAPIYAFMMYDESQMFDPPDEAQHRAAVAELGDVAVWIHGWWKAQQEGVLQ